MSFILTRKHKIVLSDYNYTVDVENRLFLSNLTSFEINVLEEIINSSLQINIKQLAKAVDSELQIIELTLSKLSTTKLFKRVGDSIIVDKSKRKYFEAQIVKFQDDFEPGMELLQSLLSNVPIHVLPMWYSIKSSDHIFNSIIEKYLATPKTYERYLSELNFENSTLSGIFQDVLEAPQLLIKAKTLMEKYRLTPEQFHEKMLLLEYNLACCLSYQRVNDCWEEVVTPFFEWRHYQCSREEIFPKSIENSSEIEQFHPQELGFVEDLAQFLRSLKKGHPFSLEQKTSFTQKTAYRDSLICRAIQLKLIKCEKEILTPLPFMEEWLQLPSQEQALFIYRQFLLQSPLKASERDIREIEKSLKPFVSKGWIYFEDFLKAFTAEIGRAEAISLKNKGKRWKYALPSYLSEEIALIELILFGKLFESGMIAMGSHLNRICFSVTPFGKTTLG